MCLYTVRGTEVFSIVKKVLLSLIKKKKKKIFPESEERSSAFLFKL